MMKAFLFGCKVFLLCIGIACFGGNQVAIDVTVRLGITRRKAYFLPLDSG